MTSSGSRRARIGTVLFLLASQCLAQKPIEVTAVLTQIEGQVTLSSEGRTEFRSVRHAAQRQVIRRGETIHLPAGSQVTVICSTDRLVRLEGPRDWTLDATACGGGLALPESTYRYAAPQAGRILPRQGVLLLEFAPRTGEDRGPILLHPRNTAVMDPRPPLVWTRVPDAVEYEIKLRGPIAMSVRVAADDAHCGAGSGPWHDLDVCSWAPSGRWPALEPDTPVFLRVDSRKTSAAPVRPSGDLFRTNLLPVNEQSAVQEALRQIATLPLNETNRLFLTAEVYAQVGLYADAIATYDKALKTEDVPEARVTLGDLYRIIGLIDLAAREYRQILADSSDPAAQAAAELGLGYADYFRRRFDEARAHFESARDAYAALGLPAEAEDARAAAVSAEEQGRADSH